MRLLAFVEYALVVIGVVGIFGGRFFYLPQGFHLGIFLVGAGIALGGLEGVLSRRTPFRLADDAHEAYAGTPAFLVGVMALVVGAAVIGSAYLLADGMWHAALARLERRPAPALTAGGILLACLGALLTLNPRGRRGAAWTLLVRLPRSLLGAVLVAAGLAAIGLGAWEWLEPRAFDRFTARLPAWPF